VNYDNLLAVTNTVTCYSWASSSGDHSFTCGRQRWAWIRTGSDWIRTEANFGRIRAGSDWNFCENGRIRTGSDW